MAKIRLGFVSNSSTSSFLLYGANVDLSAVHEVIAEKNSMTVEEVEESYDGSYEALEEVLRDSFLTFECVEYSEPYVGLSWDAVKDDETGLQFKQKIEAEVARIFGDGVKCTTHSEAWHD